MSSYLAFIHSGIKNGCVGAQDAALKDGVQLARQCIDQLDKLDGQHFPPKLLLLLASPAYLEGRRAAQLLEGVYSTFEEAAYRNFSLIGSSVAAVFFDGAVHQKGALLVCLASRLLEVEVAFSGIVAGDPLESPVGKLLEQLELDSEAGEDPDPFANRALFTFLPGSTHEGYVAADLHECLRERVWARVPIIGGVSSGFDGERNLQTVQFANRQVHKNTLVAARVNSGTLIGMSASITLEPTSFVKVTGTGAQGFELRSLNDQPVSQVLNELRAEHKFFLFGRYTDDGDPFVESPENGGGYVRLLRRTKVGDMFTVLKLERKKLIESVSDGIKRSCRAVGLINPVGCLGFRCSSYIKHKAHLEIELEEEIARVEDELQIPGDFVGGFVDGEVGKDQQGRSMLRSWSTAAAVFGDELRPRAVVYGGFFKVAKFFSLYPPPFGAPEQSVRALLDMIYDIGFPGVRLLLILDDDGGKNLVVSDSNYAVGTLGLPSAGQLPYTIRLSGKGPVSDEPAALAARTGDSQFCVYSEADGDAATSHYFTPLKNSRHEVIAVLQIDLGKEKKLRDEELLTQLAFIVGASLSRVFSTYEGQIHTQLQEALKRCLTADETFEGVQRYLAAAVKAIGLEMGHIRRLDSNYGLKLYAGVGPYYAAATHLRGSIPSYDASPTVKAFRECHDNIVNDARNNLDHVTLLTQYSEDSSEAVRRLHQLMDRLGSYANIYFESEGEIKGTINLLSEQPWFFKHPQTRVLRKIGEHIEFLVNRLDQKGAEVRQRKRAEDERADADRQRAVAERARADAERARADAEQVNQRLRFVIEATPKINNQNLDDFRGTLNELLSNFCREARARVGSLYLWDQDRELYVLRAAYRWQNKDWVDAAAYGKDDGWFGARDLMGEPRHIANLNKHYQSEGSRTPEQTFSRRGGSYAKFMFDHELSEKFQVEVIGIPLSIGQGNEIGVLALYRRTWADEKSGFVQTIIDAIRNPDERPLITGAAYEIAGLIGALVQRHDDKTEGAEQERRKEISDALSNYIERESDGSGESFESLVCRSVAQVYKTASAKLYSVEPPQDEIGLKLTQRASYPPEPHSRRRVARTPDPDVRPALDEYVAKVAGDGIKADDIYVKRRSLSPEERDDPHRAATEGLVERVCLPLLRGRELTEVLDLRWEAAARQSYEEETHFRKKYLWQLSEVFSMFSRLHKQTVERVEAEKDQKLFMGKVGAVAQAAHMWKRRLAGVFKKVRDGKESLAVDPREWEKYIDYMTENFRTFEDEMTHLLHLTESTELNPLAISPRSLIQMERRPEGEVVIGSKRREENNAIRCDLVIPQALAGVKLMVTPALMRFAFENVIDNAIDATLEDPDGHLTVTVAEGPAPQLVQVVFNNNGEPMAEDKVTAVNSNNFKKLKQSWGLMIAKCFAVCHGGDLFIERSPGGTASIFTLPVAL
jgi:signal transduction histidine kinase